MRDSVAIGLVTGVAVGLALSSVFRRFKRISSCQTATDEPSSASKSAPRLPDSPEVSGLFEVCIGVKQADLEEEVRYWAQFGFFEADDVARGHLSGAACAELYGVHASGLVSVRLFHGDSDHGLIRLMAFLGQPNALKCPSWKLTNLRAVGARWGAQLTDDVFNIHNHASDAQKDGAMVRAGEPQRCVVYKDAGRGTAPFMGQIACVRELLVIQPRAVSNFYQRYDYKIPNYGTCSHESKFRASQVTHCGLTVEGPPEILDFYDKVLGLMRQPDRKVEFGAGPEPDDESTRAIMGLAKPGDYYVTTNFDDPRSSQNVFEYRSGRLHIQRFPEGTDVPNLTKDVRPGCIGPCLYTLRVREAAAVLARVRDATGTSEVMARIVNNEFGEPSFTFVSPDGYMWNTIQN